MSLLLYIAKLMFGIPVVESEDLLRARNYRSRLHFNGETLGYDVDYTLTSDPKDAEAVRAAAKELYRNAAILNA